MTNPRRLALAVLLAVAALALPVRADEVGVDLLAGAAWSYSVDGGKTFVPARAPESAGKGPLAAKADFTVADPGALAGLWALPGTDLKGRYSVLVNGKGAPAVLAGMSYEAAMPLDPRGLLNPGANSVVFTGVTVTPGQGPGKLIAYPARLATFQRGPIVGAVENGAVGITCQTNMPAEVTVTLTPAEPAGGRETSADSPRGYYHRLRVSLPAGTKKFTYTATLKIGDVKVSDGPHAVSVPGQDAKVFRFAAAGDCRSLPQGWKSVAQALAARRPELLLFSGDLVSDGRLDHTWDTDFCTPAKGMLATVPFYCVPGNHEHKAPAYFELIHSPGKDPRAANWAQPLGGVLFVGIDGEDKWAKDSPNYTWLEGVLAGSKEKFIFLMTHYPAWSSGTHGGKGENTILMSRLVIMPLLAKYKATAMIAGHDHDYERSEPPAETGVTCIVSGGAGAPLYQKTRRGSAANPHSRVYVNVLHYCVFEVKGDTCEMKVYGLDGKVIDEKTFEART